jgi:small subunit ribosomal protein S1
MGTELQLRVIEIDPERGRIVLSERAAQSEPGAYQTLVDAQKNQTVLQGAVTNITPFGLFVNLSGIEGLVHISELSWGRVSHPREVAKIGDEVSVVVLDLDEERSRVSLSLKRGNPNPWEEAASRYPEGTKLKVEVTEVVHFGAFARVEDGLEGLIHISQMGLHERLDPRLVLERGMQLEVQVILVETERQRLSLQLLEAPWEDENSSGPTWMEDQNK